MHEDKLYENGKNEYNSIAIPSNIDESILAGIQKAKLYRRKSISQRAALLAACLITCALITMIRISPVFAGYLSELPLFEHIVKLVNFDKGLKSAVKNNFMQPVGISTEHESIKLSIDNIIVDETRMIIFYTLKNNGNPAKIRMGRVDLLDEKGEHLKAAYGITHYYSNDDSSVESNFIDVSFSKETTIPDMLTIKAWIEDVPISSEAVSIRDYPTPTQPKYLASVWELSIPIDKSKFESMKQTYDVYKTIEVENQKITFEQIIIYPTRAAITVSYDSRNSMKIFNFDDLCLIDEKGEVWGSIKNGISGSKLSDNTEVLYFESNYFETPAELYLKGSSMRALAKDKLEIVVDIVNKKLIKAPDNKISLSSISSAGDSYALDFILRKDPMDEGFHYMPFSSIFRDSANETYYDNGSSSSGGMNDGNYFNEITLYIPGDKKYTNPLIFTLDNYPNRISKEFFIKVK